MTTGSHVEDEEREHNDGYIVRRTGYIQYHIHLRQLRLLTMDENGNRNVFLVVTDFDMADYLQSHMYVFYL